MKPKTETKNTTSTSIIDDYSMGGCWHRLPCGLCRLTMEPCPKQSSSPTFPGYPYPIIYSDTINKENLETTTISTTIKGDKE